ncbi:MAG: UDP-N-acetylmuramoyl-tripeptide--D-alanyl-D-alanine ligase [Tannerellaceae bacterium]|jgi:UDP-N-acetylmuramoyl-tripeptide--D-alanyl-D-alanine ligase|nr:UDP-N-acetylmuramoyl-tripeptide--D-alanyl-D-alanine ligase [Tannerellaceae bacterium]
MESVLYEVFRGCGERIVTDSRQCKSGGLFFALKGDKFDGNRFAETALESGCCAAVVDDASCYKPDGRYFLVDNVLETLQNLAALHRESLAAEGLQVLAITGTNGKTTTKELIRATLVEKFGESCAATTGNLNNDIGVPLTLLGTRRGTSILALEMGASHPGDIGRLAAIAHPDCGLITNIGRGHLEGFGSRDIVLRTKKELFDALRQRAESFVFVNSDDAELMQAAAGLRKITYGTAETASVTGRLLSCNPCMVFEWRPGREHSFEGIKDGKYVVETHLVGDYNLYNALAAVATGCFYGVSAEAICRGIAGYQPSNSRSQMQKTGRNVLFVDAYNANPDSMIASLRNFTAVPAEHKAVILGDMLELGAESASLHAEIIQLVDCTFFEKVYLCGKEFFNCADERSFVRDFPVSVTSCFSRDNANPQIRCFRETDELVEELRRNPPEGYHILIKGSRGMCLEKVIPFL